MKYATTAALFAGALLLAGCGFHPLYATPDGGAPISERVAVRQVTGPETIQPAVEDALSARLSSGSATPRYDLFVNASESAQRLAVQIDATVTRYNYRLNARYLAVDRETGDRFSGSARAVTAYNIVSSQYSTLFAEKAAVEKAATLLAEEIERDLLIRFSEPPDAKGALTDISADAELAPTEVLMEPRRGELVEPILEPVDPGAAEDAAPDAAATKD